MLATEDGCQGAEDIAKAGHMGQAPKNSARDIKRSVLKNCDAPVPYMVTIPTWNSDTGSKEYSDWPVLLPHEMLVYLVDSGRCTINDMADMDGRDDITIKHRKASFCAAHGLGISTCIPLVFHGDGLPMQKATHNQQTTEVYSWNLLCDRDGKRYLFTNIHKKFMCDCGCRGRCTLDPLLEVFAWSMKVMLGGRHPSVSHDGTKLDIARAAKGNKPLGFTGGLMQARGDWQFYNAVFSFPAWNSGQMCWKCRASQEGRFAYWKCGPTAAWRSTRYTSGEFLDNLQAQGVSINPLFTAPGFTIDDVCIGRLHAMDLGVSQEISGNIFWEAVLHLRMPGRNQALRIHSLWVRIKAYYAARKPTSQLQKLTQPMVKKDKKPPRLRSKGAETRHLVPYAVQLAQQLHDMYGTEHTHWVLDMVTMLNKLYDMMDKDYDHTEAKRMSIRICVLYTKLSLEAANENIRAWKIKPKLHMMQELLEYQGEELGNPRGFWEYKDEDFVGIIATLALRRGGPNTPNACAAGVVDRYRALLQLGSI